MKIVAFDLGTKTGIAACDDNGKINSTMVNLVSKIKNEPYGKRPLRFYTLVSELIKDADLVVFEDVQNHGKDGTYAAHLYGGFKAILTLLCEKNDINYTSIHTGTLKKAITGKGNAKKEEMIAAAIEKHNWVPTLSRVKRDKTVVFDDNECDAYCLLMVTLNNIKKEIEDELE